ncbi:MAG: hypothetical protein HQ521_12955 [Bacteroidetes bacterium]|nr:hypothetical protein [Bacteroidota bacterium]
MKKLSKLFIDSKKEIKKEELVLLRGGYDGCPFCRCYYDILLEIYAGSIESMSSAYECASACTVLYGNPYSTC